MLQDPLLYWNDLTSKEMFGNSLHLHFTEYNGIKNEGSFSDTYVEQIFTCMLDFDDEDKVRGGITSIGKWAPDVTIGGNRSDISFDFIQQLLENDIIIKSNDIAKLRSLLIFYNKTISSGTKKFENIIDKGVEHYLKEYEDFFKICIKIILKRLSKNKLNISLDVVKDMITSLYKDKLDYFDDINGISLRKLIEYKKKGIFYYTTCRTIIEDTHGPIRREISQQFEEPVHRLCRLQPLAAAPPGVPSAPPAPPI